MLFEVPLLSSSVGSRCDDQCVCVCQPKTLRPKAVLFRQSNMTSVLAVRHKTWVVFLIGTGDGQLIKVCVISICATDIFHLFLLYQLRQSVKLYLSNPYSQIGLLGCDILCS